MKTLQSILNDKTRLPSPPAIAIRILEEVRKDDFSFMDLAKIITADPALSARILGVANSSYYGLSAKVASIERALSVLGTHAVKNIALSFVITGELRGQETADAEQFDFDLFWRRAITAAVAAELASSLVGNKNEDIFITALLQDIGVLAFNACMPEIYPGVLKEKNATQRSLLEVERQRIGFDHQMLGAELLCAWKLPESIFLPILYHHDVDQAPPEYRAACDLLAISDHLSGIYHRPQSVDEVRMVRMLLERDFGVSGEPVNALIDAVANKSLEMLQLFELPPGSMRPYSSILQEANEELSSLNISYEMLIIELREQKEKAERLANELDNANKKLHDLAFRDGLTGLYNHRYFQEAMDQEMGRALRYSRNFALILFDIDHFKKINDTYGHPQGDHVLIVISRCVEKVLRLTDIYARYGGEEFAIILPETDYTGAQILAERLRSSIESLNIESEDGIIKVTVSVGYTSYRPGARINEKGTIISMADKALYVAKQSGRNRIHALKLPGT